MSITDTTKTGITVVSGLCALVAIGWGAASTMTEAKLRGIVIEVVNQHDRDMNAHPVLMSRYLSPGEQARQTKAIEDLVNDFRAFQADQKLQLETLTLGQARVEGRLKAKTFIHSMTP